MERRIALFGCTGTVGKQTLNVVRGLGDKIRVVGLVAKNNVDVLEAQVREFNPEIIAVYEEKAAMELKRRLPGRNIVTGAEGLVEVASYKGCDFAIMAMVGSMGILPAIAAIRAGKDIGLANKEILVAAGEFISTLAKEKGVKIIPIDSEHSAIFQCLQGEDINQTRKLILTASGGPFLHYTEDQLKNISLQDAKNHPTWTMGEKVSVDCSTLMNKGFEVIEACWLFNYPAEKIEVVIHPESIVQSFVEFHDGALKALIARPNMEIPIQYALTYPNRIERDTPSFDFSSSPILHFHAPDRVRFRCLNLAYEALKGGGTLPCFMNAANEVLVERFCQGEVSWLGISEKLEKLMMRHQVVKTLSIDSILAVDQEARLEAKTV